MGKASKRTKKYIKNGGLSREIKLRKVFYYYLATSITQK